MLILSLPFLLLQLPVINSLREYSTGMNLTQPISPHTTRVAGPRRVCSPSWSCYSVLCSFRSSVEVRHPVITCTLQLEEKDTSDALLRGHTASVQSLTMSADGRLL